MLSREAWILVIASYLLISFSYLWPQYYRNASPSYVTIATAAFTAVAVVAAVARNWRLTAAASPLLVFTVGPALWQYRPEFPPQIPGETVTVMSANLLRVNRNIAPIIDEIRAADPDILLLQEYTAHWHSALQAAIGREYPHERHVCRDDSFGTAIYSKRPFVGGVNMAVPLGSAEEPQVRAVVRIAGREVAVYNVHLLPPSGLDYTIENRRQFADLLDRLPKEPLPVIMGGDFNFTETTPHAAALGHIRMLEAFDLGGWGRGATWPVNSFFRWVPGIRLDHLYLRGNLTCSHCRTGIGRGSDHRPLIAKIGFSR
jgi:endonuclease/exonuclease/phosphatase (EEP) superfamily protein YafD